VSQPPKPPSGATVLSSGISTPVPSLDPMQHVAVAHSGRLLTDIVGTVLSQRYRVLKKLGEGGMGSVYLAEHTTINKKLAIKVLSPDYSQKPDLVDRFLQEARAASMIDQENVVEITDFGTVPGGTVFFVMEYLNGEDLAATIKREGPMPWERVRPIMLQICDALAAAHDVGIIHRDMKPENCYRIRRGSNSDFIKVLDFGIAKVTSEESEGGGKNLTRTGMIFGTPEYMSPEQAKGERVDHRVDVYAVGIILYELLTGRVPFLADTFMGTLTKHMFEAPPAPAAVAPGVMIPPDAEAIILKALQKERDYRFQSMGEMANALRAVGTGAAPVAVVRENVATPSSGRIRYAADRGGETLVDEHDFDLRPQRSSSWPLIVGLGVGVLALSGAAAWWAGLIPRGIESSSTPTEPTGPAGVNDKDPSTPSTDKPTVDKPTSEAAGGANREDPGPKAAENPSSDEATPTPPAKPTTVELKVTTEGYDAVVHDARDHKELGVTNAAITIPYGEEPYEVQVSAPGRETQSIQILPKEDLMVVAELVEVKKKKGTTKKRRDPEADAPATTTPVVTPVKPTNPTKPTTPKPSGSPDLKNPFG